ncbi:MAG: tetratricopeptide repeat protein [Bryobacteraceae bacterium]
MATFFIFLFFAQSVPIFEERIAAEHAARLKTDDRILFYQKIVTTNPKNVHYKIWLAGAYVQKMRETTDFTYINRAAGLLDTVLSADPGNYEALRLQAMVQLEYHQFSKAVESSQALIGMKPGDPWNYGILGDAFIEIGDYEKAADAFQKMADIRPDLSSYNRAAHYHFLNNDVKGAIDLMKRAVSAGSSAPENVAWCLVELGHIYMKTGQLDEAENAYRSALRYFPASHSALAGLGKVQAMKGELPEAIESYRHAQSITPLPDYASALFDLYSAQGRKKDAEQQMQTLDMIDKMMQVNHEKVNRNLALIYADHDRRLDRALQLAQAELGSRRDVYTYDALAWALYKSKRFDEAAQASEKALKLNTPEPSFYYHAGMIAAALGKIPEAQKDLERALALNPKFDILQARLAGERLGELTRASTE